ncbi:MAG: AfsR/SARP family transcriptional regulator [Phycicoccus sp.]
MFEVLGPLRVNGKAGPIPRHPRALLTALVLSQGTSISRSQIVDVLWERPPASAGPNVRNGIAALRRYLEAIGMLNRIQTVPEGYLLAMEPDELDLHRFTGLASRGKSLLNRADFDGAVALLSEATALWRGPFGQDLPETRWFRSHAAGLISAQMSATEDLFTALFLAEDCAILSYRIEAILAESPYRQRLWELLVASHCSVGDAVSALAAVRRCQVVYAEDLGLDLPPTLRELERVALNWETRMARSMLFDHLLGSSTVIS